MSLRQRRIESEWILLSNLQTANANVLSIAGRETTPLQDIFHLVLTETNALMRSHNGLQIQSAHKVRVCFPRFFPSVPSETYLEVPVFHPNVDPENGYVCLWARFSIDNNIVKALQILQAVISWHAFNWQTDHLIQADAKAWYDSAPPDICRIPLEYTALLAPASAKHSREPQPSRRRLNEYGVPPGGSSESE
jgi:ubiquitin-protein ligase